MLWKQIMSEIWVQFLHIFSKNYKELQMDIFDFIFYFCGLSLNFLNAPGGTRTPNLVIRSHMLYPVELRALFIKQIMNLIFLLDLLVLTGQLFRQGRRLISHLFCVKYNLFCGLLLCFEGSCMF